MPTHLQQQNNTERFLGCYSNVQSSVSATSGTHVALYAGGAIKLNTNSEGIDITGKIDFNTGNTNAIILPQGRKIAMGIEKSFKVFENGVGDGRVKHEGNTVNDIGNISITVPSRDGATKNHVLISNNSGGSTAAKFNVGAATELYYNGAIKLETLSGNGNGVKVTGDLQVTADIIAFSGSDLRLKTNINPIVDALNKVKSISGNTFEWNENSNHEGWDTGVIAQEIKELELPGITKERDDGYLGVRYEKLVPLLIEAIKELSDKVDDLEQKLSDK